MEELILEALRVVLDPEIGINIVDLGLVYAVRVNQDQVQIDLTMTSPTCPLHAVIARDVETVLLGAFPHLRRVTVDLVWEPAWHPQMMSDSAKQELGWA